MDFLRLFPIVFGFVAVVSGQDSEKPLLGSAPASEKPRPLLVATPIALPEVPVIAVAEGDKSPKIQPEKTEILTTRNGDHAEHVSITTFIVDDFEQPQIQPKPVAYNSAPVLAQSGMPDESKVHFTHTAEHVRTESMNNRTGDLLSLLEIGECPVVTCKSTSAERVQSWTCEYTKYIAETVAWLESFEEWWAGCLESVDGMRVMSGNCPDNSKVRCLFSEKRRCADDRMGCTRCICTDGKYHDPMSVSRNWNTEMPLFKERYGTYKSRIASCTRVTSPGCDAQEGSSGSGDGKDISVPVDGSGSGSGDDMMANTDSPAVVTVTEPRTGSGSGPQ